MKQIAPTQLQRLRILLEGYAGGPLPDFEQFAKGVGEVTIPARHTLVAAGDHHPYIDLVNRGLLKTVYTPQPGAPRILAFTAPRCPRWASAACADCTPRGSTPSRTPTHHRPRAWPAAPSSASKPAPCGAPTTP